MSIVDRNVARARDLVRNARGASRLVGFSGSTLYHMSQLLIADTLGHHTPEGGARQTQLWSRQLLSICGIEVQVTGKPPPGGSVLVCNHRSYMDIGVVAAQCPCVFLAKQEIASWPLLGRSARLAGTVFVARGSRTSGAEAVRSLREYLDRGLTVIIFPEGTTFEGPGVLPFQGGIFRQAAQMGVPVAPAAISYAEPGDAWVGSDDGSFFEHFVTRLGRPKTHVSLTFGTPLEPGSASSLRAAAQAWVTEQLVGKASSSGKSSEGEAPSTSQAD